MYGFRYFGADLSRETNRKMIAYCLREHKTFSYIYRLGRVGVVDNGRGAFRDASGFFDKLRDVKTLNQIKPFTI